MALLPQYNCVTVVENFSITPVYYGTKLYKGKDTLSIYRYSNHTYIKDQCTPA